MKCGGSSVFLCRPANTNAVGVPMTFRKFQVGSKRANGVDVYFWIGSIGSMWSASCTNTALTAELINGNDPGLYQHRQRRNRETTDCNRIFAGGLRKPGIRDQRNVDDVDRIAHTRTRADALFRRCWTV